MSGRRQDTLNQPDMIDVYSAIHTIEQMFGVRIKVEFFGLSAGDFGPFRYSVRAVAYLTVGERKWSKLAEAQGVWPCDATKHMPAMFLKIVLELDAAIERKLRPTDPA